MTTTPLSAIAIKSRSVNVAFTEKRHRTINRLTGSSSAVAGAAARLGCHTNTHQLTLTHSNPHEHTATHTREVKGTLCPPPPPRPPPNRDEGFCFAQGLTHRAGTSSTVPTLRSGCPLFWSSRLRLSTVGGKRQTVNYFVHITHVPQLRQEHLVTVPEITVPQWRTRKVRQMEGQRRESRAATHPSTRASSPRLPFHESGRQ